MTDFSNHLVCLNFTPFLKLTALSHLHLPLSKLQQMDRSPHPTFFYLFIFSIIQCFGQMYITILKKRSVITSLSLRLVGSSDIVY